MKKRAKANYVLMRLVGGMWKKGHKCKEIAALYHIPNTKVWSILTRWYGTPDGRRFRRYEQNLSDAEYEKERGEEEYEDTRFSRSAGNKILHQIDGLIADGATAVKIHPVALKILYSDLELCLPEPSAELVHYHKRAGLVPLIPDGTIPTLVAA